MSGSRQSAEFSASNLPESIYIGKIIAGENTIYKRLAIVNQ